MIERDSQAGLCTAFCICLNCLLRFLSTAAGLPLRLESLGTVLAAYLMGPAPAVMIGAATGIVRSFHDSAAIWVMVPNALIGLIVGIFARKGCFRSFFDTVATSAATSALAAVGYTVINCTLYGGLSGNSWADGIFKMLREYGAPVEASALIGEFFLDFLDQLVIMMVIFGGVRLGKRLAADIHGAKARQLFRLGVLAVTVIATVVMLLAVPVSARDSTPDYSHYIRTVYSSGNGLPSGEATDVASTDDGIIWIGTYAGLYRCSGDSFQYMRDFADVKNVNCLYVDVEGRLWIGTNDDGLSICIDNEIINTFGTENGFPCDAIHSVIQSADGNFYVGTSQDLVVLTLSGGSRVVKTYPQISYVRDLTADEAGHVAALTADGELYLMGSEGILQRTALHSGSESFTSCEFGADGRLYVGTSTGVLWAYTLRNERLSICVRQNTQGLNTIRSIRQLENGCMFLCADNQAAWLDGERKLHLLDTGDFNSQVERVTVDYQGNLWFTSGQLGVMKLCPSAFTEVYSETGLPSRKVNTIALWRGRLYFGTDEGVDLVRRADGKVETNELSELLAGCRVRCSLTDRAGRLWLCTDEMGVICAETPTICQTFGTEEGVLGTQPQCILELADGSFALGTEKGITFLKDGRVDQTVSKQDGLVSPSVLCLLELRDGTLLAGTDGGGIALIRRGRVAQILDRDAGLSSGVVLRMVQDRQSDCVLVVTSNGICLYRPDTGVKLLRSFPYSNNYDLLDRRDGRVYVTCSAGIYVVDKQELLEDRVERYENLNYLSGLRGRFTANSWNYLDGTGSWYIAGSSGVTRFDFGQYATQERRSYRMQMKRVTIDSVVHQLNDDTVITVPSGAVSLTLSPEIINYSAREPYVCYYLEGAEDAEKTVVLQRNLGDIIYNNLETGEYRFHLSILDGARGKPIEELIYTIRKEAEDYEHMWFRMLFFAELILIVAWFTWFCTRKWTQREMNLQRKEIELAKNQVRMGNETILAIAKTVDAKDENTSQHSFRVSQYACRIAERMGYSAEELENLRRAALLHDIGKIGIRDAVLNKPGRLTDEEFALMKSHVTMGGDILKEFTLIPHVQEGALYHHERYDGKGYVQGLSGKDIPEIARIIGVADAFDAMTANRVYRQHLDFATVLSEMRKGRGTQFDPEILDVFLSLIDDGTISEETLYGKEGQ